MTDKLTADRWIAGQGSVRMRSFSCRQFVRFGWATFDGQRASDYIGQLIELVDQDFGNRFSQVLSGHLAFITTLPLMLFCIELDLLILVFRLILVHNYIAVPSATSLTPLGNNSTALHLQFLVI